MLALTAHELLTTTRSVRKRLDFSRPVPRALILECIEDALQAPSGSNRWSAHFVVVDDPDLRRRLGDIYAEAYARYRTMEGTYIGSLDKGDAARNEQQQRTARSADHLGEHMGDAAAIVIGCVGGRSSARSPSLYASIMPAMWSFMLAARLRGLGTSWTGLHLSRERDVAELLEIPYEEVAQVCMTPVAYTRGTTFKPALRPDPDECVHWNGWSRDGSASP